MNWTPLVAKGGPFFTIIKASTNQKLTKHAIQQVDVEETCDSLISYSHPETRDDERFSLRLSAQLAHGAVWVLNQQTTYLLQDVERTYREISSWSAKQKFGTIDLPRQSDVDLQLLREPPISLDAFEKDFDQDFEDFVLRSRQKEFVVQDLSSITLQEETPHKFSELDIYQEPDVFHPLSEDEIILAIASKSSDDEADVTAMNQVQDLLEMPGTSPKLTDQSKKIQEDGGSLLIGSTGLENLFGNGNLFEEDIDRPLPAQSESQIPTHPEEIADEPPRPADSLTPSEELVLPPLKPLQKFTKIRKLAIDKIIKIPNEKYSANLKAHENISETPKKKYAVHGSFSVDQLFSSSCHETADIKSSYLDPYQKRTKNGRFGKMPISVPVQLFDEALESINEHINVPKLPALEVLDEAAERQPKEHPDHDVQMDIASSEVPGLPDKMQETPPQDQSSFVRANIGTSMEERRPLQGSLLPQDVEEFNIPDDANQFNNFHVPENFPEKPPAYSDVVYGDRVMSTIEIETQHSLDVSRISKKLSESLSGESFVMFSTLVPPGTLKKKAVTTLVVLLKLAKDRKVDLIQENEDIRVEVIDNLL